MMIAVVDIDMLEHDILIFWSDKGVTGRVHALSVYTCDIAIEIHFTWNASVASIGIYNFTKAFNIIVN